MTMQKRAYLHGGGPRLNRIGRRYEGWCDDGRCVAQSMMHHLNRACQHQRLQDKHIPISDQSHHLFEGTAGLGGCYNVEPTVQENAHNTFTLVHTFSRQ